MIYSVLTGINGEAAGRRCNNSVEMLVNCTKQMKNSDSFVIRWCLELESDKLLRCGRNKEKSSTVLPLNCFFINTFKWKHRFFLHVLESDKQGMFPLSAVEKFGDFFPLTCKEHSGTSSGWDVFTAAAESLEDPGEGFGFRKQDTRPFTGFGLSSAAFPNGITQTLLRELMGELAGGSLDSVCGNFWRTFAFTQSQSHWRKFTLQSYGPNNCSTFTSILEWPW